MKVKVGVERGSLELIPETDAEAKFLDSWFASGRLGRVEIGYISRNLKTHAIGLAIYKEEKTMLTVQPGH